MPEQLLYIDERIQLAFVDFCLDSGYYFYADDMLPDAEFPAITSMLTFTRQLENWGPLGNQGKFFMGHESYSESPPLVGKILCTEGEFFFIRQKHAGPFIDLILPRRYEAPDGRKLIVGGQLGYYAEYVNILNETCKTPPSLVHCYRQLSVYLRKQVVQNRHGRRFLISKSVIDEVDRGWQLSGRVVADSKELHRLL